MRRFAKAIFRAKQRCNIVPTLFRMVTTDCSNFATLCCAKNRRCESCRVTSPLRADNKCYLSVLESSLSELTSKYFVLERGDSKTSLVSGRYFLTEASVNKVPCNVLH